MRRRAADFSAGLLAWALALSAPAQNEPGGQILRESPAAPPAEIQPARNAGLAASRPPLSLMDVLKVMEETGDVLRDSADRINPDANRVIRDRLESIAAYVRAVDDTNPSLPSYKWHFVDRSRVGEAVTDTDVFRPPRTLPGVTAVSLRVIRGDVRVERVRVFDKSGGAYEFNLGKVIPADSPRREVCMLETAVDLDRVEILYRGVSRQEAKAPRLILEAGISSVPEYARQCNHELKLAALEIEAKDYSAGEKHVREASRLLAAYLQSRRM